MATIFGWLLGKVLNLFSIGFWAYRAGTHAEKAAIDKANMEANLEAQRDRVELENNIGAMPDGDVRKRLRDQWARDR